MTCPPFLALMAPSFILLHLVTTPPLAVVSCGVFRFWGCCVLGYWGGLRGVVDLVGFGPCRAYLKRFSPAPSSHLGRCTLIRCAGTLDPCMQR